jgi:hypothetical protein
VRLRKSQHLQNLGRALSNVRAATPKENAPRAEKKAQAKWFVNVRLAATKAMRNVPKSAMGKSSG